MHKNQDKNFAPEKQRKWKKRTRNRPKRAKPGAFWMLGRGAAGADGWENQKSEPKRTPFPYDTCKKKTGENPEFPPVLWQGQKDLNPRHAVLEWMWESAPGSKEKADLPGSCCKSERGRCWFGAAGKNPAQSTQKLRWRKQRKGFSQQFL